MKPYLNRRQFLTTIGIGVVAAPTIKLQASPLGDRNSATLGEGLKLWIDPYYSSQKKMPWRKVHLDFHNSKYITLIGEKFDPVQWGDQLVAGNLDSIVVFAKDMHGYFYYPSHFGPVHPGLSFDLLGEQVKACRERHIAVYAYYCVAWDHYLAETHPEWNMRKIDGSDYRPLKGETPGWTALCLGNEDFVDLMANHIQEFVAKYDLDGAWIDMAEPIAPECYCTECVRKIKATGKDPFDKEVQLEHQNKNFIEFHRRMKELVHHTKPDCQIDFNDIGIGKVSERAGTLDSIDVEALPTDPQWGYFYAPLQVRYQRNFNLPVYGQTGRFVTSWADFGGLKLSQQLDVELASLVANATRCDVGDQMPPNGVLDKAVYHVLGKSFGKIKQLQPWLEQAAPVTDTVLLIPSIPLLTVRQKYIYGIAKLMIETHLQFDALETSMEWERYRLVVIPDELMPDEKTISRLHQFIAKGGAVIVCHNGGLQEGTNKSWLSRYGLIQDGLSPFDPAYLVTDDHFIADMPGYEYALYGGASQWKVQLPALSLALLGEPLFQRSAEHYTSHKQSPFDHATDYSVIATSGKIGLLGFPIGEAYYDKGYWIYREAFINLIKKVLPNRLIETNAPLSTEITITYQPANKDDQRPERFLVHIINWSPNRKTPSHSEVHEDPIALTDIRVKLNIPFREVTVKMVASGEKLKHNIAKDGIEVTIPRIPISEIVCFEGL